MAKPSEELQEFVKLPLKKSQPFGHFIVQVKPNAISPFNKIEAKLVSIRSYRGFANG
jgi:hypothetical protein